MKFLLLQPYSYQGPEFKIYFLLTVKAGSGSSPLDISEPDPELIPTRNGIDASYLRLEHVFFVHGKLDDVLFYFKHGRNRIRARIK